MSKVGQVEKKTQDRVVSFFQEQLGYDYLGNWLERSDNKNIELGLLRSYLAQKGYSDGLVSKTIYQLEKSANNQSLSIYDRNKEVYVLLRYGVKVKTDISENYETVWLIDWENPLKNDFAIAEEVTVKGANAKANGKRPDIILYVNGIALGVLELKRSMVSVSEGIRQNLDNQLPIFIQPFFSTIQLIMAGNDTEGIQYGTIETKEKYYLTWKEQSPIESRLERHLFQLCNKHRLLELIHDFIVFDAGTKKLCRQNQYFGVRAAQEFVKRREGGIIWHTQGSGKSMTMVWLAKWIRENLTDSRVLIITDRTELDEQIEKVFLGLNESIYRAKSGADLITTLNAHTPSLICSLVHKFGGKEDGEYVGDISSYIDEVKKAVPKDFKAKGDIYVFVDECHRSQSGDLHRAMKAILPDAMFIGFTGTPLLKTDKQKSIEVFGRYIHTYKFNEAVQDKVVLDLRYEARDIDQSITSQQRIDQWFEAKTRGLTDMAKALLKQKWGTMQRVLSCQSRLEKIVSDILLDMSIKPRLMDGHGNAMLVAGSIYEACKFYELFFKTELAGKCAIITSYSPSAADIKGEETGEGETEKQHKFATYRKMLADWFKEDEEKAVKRSEEFEKAVKKKFVEEPGQMKLVIVVDKLLTGFDAPSATYLYIDKQMRDHGLFQAICRVNRLDGDDKQYGYIIDYKDLFKGLEKAVQDYTSGALDGYDKTDVEGLLKDRLEEAREDLEEAREIIKALCEPVEPPKETADYLRYFCGTDSGDAGQLKENEPKRLKLYKFTGSLLRAFGNIANELPQAGYSDPQISKLKDEVAHFERVRNEVKIASGDYIDLKMYEPAMRHLIDTYIRAEDSQKISAFDDLSLIQLIVQRGSDAIDMLPTGIKRNKEAVAETIENNVRKIITDEQPMNPKYYERMSELLDALIEKRRQEAIEYEQYLAEIVALTKKVNDPGLGANYPKEINSPAKRAIYDNLDQDLDLTILVDHAITSTKKDDWRGSMVKEREVKYAIRKVLKDETKVETIFELAKKQHEY
ncbi:MAG: type I restriction endonuclease subunit R [Cyanobacteria bacterium HKST-UBA02]|nr:type I restriction endonuclease subunit R [Cyanobacteria bacterium HKST-UBA02]